MPTKGYRTEAERRLTMGDVLGLTKLPKLRDAMNAGGKPGDVPKFVPDGTPLPKDSPRDERGQLRKPHGQTRGLKHFAPGGLCAPKPFDPLAGPDGERPNQMTFGEQFVELLGEFVDAREQYAHSRRHVGGEYANSDDMDKAGNALQALLDKRFP